jgi:hypothetical protein
MVVDDVMVVAVEEKEEKRVVSFARSRFAVKRVDFGNLELTRY